MRRQDDTIIRRKDFTGDNWHTTWADDDLQYTGLCDGFGLPGVPRKWYNSRLFTIAGDPPMPRSGTCRATRTC